ncbi:MAG: hypothetical protein JJU25_14650 [Halomonas sp.]|nr:hypothetical protein [Halomonas sp.]MCC5883858.1 hypothetical protein [Halomonas sp.]
MNDTPSRTSSDSDTDNGSGRPGIDRDELRHHAEEARDELRDAAKQQAESLLDRQKAAAADQAEKVAAVLHKTADEFERQQQPYFSGCVNELARRSDAFSRTLRERDLETLLESTRRYSRQHPALFLGGAIAAGFMLSRFLRSSHEVDGQHH